MKRECFYFKNVDQQWCLQHETARCSQGIILLSQMKDKYDLIAVCMKNIILSLSGSCKLAELCYSVMFGIW